MDHRVTLPLCILEEIGFEGLEGIAVEGLWKRISARIKLPIPLNARAKKLIWEFILEAKCLKFYILPEEREPLKIYDRIESVDPFFGTSEPETCPYTFYKYNPISTDGVRGSCEHYETREEISKEKIAKYASTDDVENEYGRRLVIVASQSLRDSLLLPPTLPNDVEISTATYCILERLGRARYNGELAQGKFSLFDIAGDPVTFHIQKKKLMKHKLMECQAYSHHINGQNTSGQLCHLPRFFAQFKPRHIMVMERVVDFLKSKPNCMAEYQDVKNQFDAATNKFLRRFFKTSFFQKYIITDAKVPYRAIHPDATEQEWKTKNSVERTLHVLQLKNPNVDCGDFELKRDMVSGNDEDDLDDDDIEKGFTDVTCEVLGVPLLHQVYEFIKSRKDVGASELEIRIRFGQNKLGARALVRKIIKLCKIEFYTVNRQRQNIRMYVLPEYNKKRKKSKVVEVPEFCDTTTIEEVEAEEDEQSQSQSQPESQSRSQDVEMSNITTEDVIKCEQIENPLETIMDTKIDNDESNDEEMDVSIEEILDPAKETHKRIDENITVKITQINQTEYCRKLNKRQITDEILSERSKTRIEYMLQEIASKILYDDSAKLYTALKQEEESHGLKDRMCKKTFYRLLTYMSQKQLIRLWHIQFQYQSKFRTIMYITKRNVDANFSLMKSCIEQAKSKFRLNIFDEENRRDAKKSVKCKKLPHLKQATPGPRLTVSSNQALNYGSTPKFIRLRTLHEFLYYIIYEMKNSDERPPKEEIIAQWKENTPVDFDDIDIDTMPEIWLPEMGWKMFIPPLIKHNGFGDGWCLLSDCIFRMPVSVFVRIVNISHEIQGLDDFLAHPIKKHFLIKDLPIQMQQQLFVRRKHIASLHELMRRLCCIGLVQIGPHRAIKDQSFYYLNQRATLHDTSSSEQGLYYVSDLEYPATYYELNTLENVYNYWDDMHSICMSTKLNRKSLSTADTPYGKVLPERLLPYIKAIQPRQATERDTGEIPGDHRGAACLDSCLFAHLERSWSFNSARFIPKTQMKIKTTVAPIRYNRLVRMTRDATLKRHESMRSAPVPLHKLKSSVVRRRVPPTRKKTIIVKRQRIYRKYDEIDRMALQKMSKLRVDWNQQEDNCLLLCKVAQMYLNPNNRLVMPTQVIRDLLHWNCKSINKTALACRRRISYITRKVPNSEQINNSIMMCLNEIKENKYIQKRFGVNLIKNLKKIYPDENELYNAFRIHFIDLVHTLSRQFFNLTNSFQSNPIILPKTIDEFHDRFFEKTDSVYDANTIRYDEPKTEDDIKVATIITLIHSTMCCCHDKTSLSIQLYEIYKDFPEKLLSAAMHKVRSDQLISHNKITGSQRKAHNRCLPLSSSSYHLSATYQQQMTTKISYDLFDEAFQVLEQMNSDLTIHNEPHVFSSTNNEICFFITEFLHKKSYDIVIDIPKRLLLLDPTKRLPDETFQGIYARFHEIFNYIPKIDLVGSDDNSLDEFLMELPNNEDKAPVNQTKSIIKRLENLPSDILHFFCIIDNYGVTKPRNQLELDADGKCPLDCMKNLANPFDQILDKLLAKREVWYRLNIEQQELGPLPAVVTIDEFNIVAVYSFLITEGSTTTEDQRTDHLDRFKQVSEIVDEILLENDKDFIDDDFDVEYDLKSDMKKKLYDGSQINDKIHKFHDFLCINTCKLSLLSKESEDSSNDIIDLDQLNKQRDDILAKIIKDANWSPELKSNGEFVDQLLVKGLTMDEVHIAIDVFNYIDVQGEMGASASNLSERYENKEFLQTLLDLLNDLKLVMKTGVCEVTFVHWKHIKPWVVNTYNLKRLEKESIEPMTKSLMKVSDRPSTSKELKRPSTQNFGTKAKRTKEAKVQNENGSSDSDTECQDIVGATVTLIQVSAKPDDATKPINSKHSKRLLDKSIQYETEVASQHVPQTKKTFPLKMAPWIRVNGSINRRVLDKYAGTVLMHCIENAGLTLFTLCTRFHYLLPIHVHELIEYLEDFGCVTKTAIPKVRPVTLFSEYQSFRIKPATSLDEFKDITIEPTIDAVTKMTIFIGNKKYKEDFI